MINAPAGSITAAYALSPVLLTGNVSNEPIWPGASAAALEDTAQNAIAVTMFRVESDVEANMILHLCE